MADTDELGNMKGDAVFEFNGDVTIVAGASANLKPSCRKIEDKYASPSYVTGNVTDGKTNNGRTGYEAIDNATDHIGGLVTIVGLNGINLESGSGGINFNSVGNTVFTNPSGLLTLSAGTSLNICGDQINMASNEATVIKGGEIQCDAPATFNGKLSLGSNLRIQGSLGVNGNLIARQLTMEAMPMQTEFADAGGSYLNPKSAFNILDANSLIGTDPLMSIDLAAAQAVQVSSLAELKIPNGTFISPALGAAVLAATLGAQNPENPEPAAVALATTLSTMLTAGAPCLYNINPIVLFHSGMLTGTNSSVGGAHCHVYKVPKWKIVDEMSDLNTELQKVESDEPVAAEGIEALGAPMKELKKKAKQYGERILESHKERFKELLPGWLSSII